MFKNDSFDFLRGCKRVEDEGWLMDQFYCLKTKIKNST